MTLPWRPKPDAGAIGAEVLAIVRDALRGGASLRQSLATAAARVRTFAEAWDHVSIVDLALGQRLASVAGTLDDATLASAMRCLAVHVQTGGDPIPLIDSIEERIRERELTERELRSLTTQARMSARALMCLTPGMLALLGILDPKGMVRSLRTPPAAWIFLLGIALEFLGAWWISRIVSPQRVAGDDRPRSPAIERFGGVPVMRAVVALTRGRPIGVSAIAIADAADQLALVLDAGLSPVRAMEVVAPAASGSFGEAMRAACNGAGDGQRRDAWSRLAAIAPDADALVESLVGAQERGVPAAESLRRLAGRLRRRHSAEVAERVRGASIKVLVPLSLLILPSFVLACLVPLLLGGIQGLSQ